MADVVNQAQAAAWNGGQARSWLDREEQHATASRAHREALLDGAAIAPGEQVLDVGCGTGATTLVAALATGEEGIGVGLDISEPLLARARQRAAEAGITNVEFVCADAQVAPLDEGRFDAVISKFGVMFFENAVAAFLNLAHAIRPGGRIAFVSWRPPEENEWIRVLRAAVAGDGAPPSIAVGAPGMFGLAEREHVARVVATAGFVDLQLDPVDLPYGLGPLDDACAFGAEVGVVRALLQDLTPAEHAVARASLRDALAAHDGPDGVVLGSAIWLVTARR